MAGAMSGTMGGQGAASTGGGRKMPTGRRGNNYEEMD